MKSLGHPIDGILKAARWMDHVILVSIGRTGRWISSPLGAIADKMVRHTLVPVMIIH